MNVPILIAAGLALLAFAAHAFIGDKELGALRPDQTTAAKPQEAWIQTRAGWHWVSVDLLFSGILLGLIATTDVIIAQAEILRLLALYFAACGVVWLATVIFSKNRTKQIFILGQWIFCFLMSGLIYAGM